ncbi:hypothetical protein DSM110093_01723 [Sulfitobacter sp. DSM 110093]|nr:hypothetical protein DSM110093_01723 [Sulfitobacter sp. DSM 110093]
MLEDARQTVLIHQAWADSDKVYGSRRGNCHDNVVAESFFHLWKREPIRRQTYLIRDAARQYVFGYIEMFYNPTGKHTNNGMLSPVNYEIKQQKMNEPGA